MTSNPRSKTGTDYSAPVFLSSLCQYRSRYRSSSVDFYGIIFSGILDRLDRNQHSDFIANTRHAVSHAELTALDRGL